MRIIKSKTNKRLSSHSKSLQAYSYGDFPTVCEPLEHRRFFSAIALPSVIPNATESHSAALVNPLVPTDAVSVKKTLVINPTPVPFSASPQITSVFRLYNPITGDHLDTMDANENAVLPTRGWVQEGTPFSAYDGPVTGAIPLYRLYNSASHQHLLTTDANEESVLSAQKNWVAEGVAGYVINSPSIAAGAQGYLYRLSNQYGQHLSHPQFVPS